MEHVSLCEWTVDRIVQIVIIARLCIVSAVSEAEEIYLHLVWSEIKKAWVMIV